MKKTTLSLLALLTFSSTLFASSLVVYNSNIGLVHEEKELNIKKSDTEIIYEDVASTINTDSVNVKISPSVTLYSQQYRYDKLTLAKLLQAHLNKQVQTENKKYLTLLSYDAKNAIVKNKDNKIITVKNRDIIFDTIPKSLLIKPSLVWNIQAKKDVHANLELDYIINHINFQSDYVLNLTQDKADLAGWINVRNNSGKSFHNTKLYLLAGDINRATQDRISYRKNTIRALQSAPEASHQAFEGYHLYTVPFRVNLANNEKTQIKFLSKNEIPIKREYSAKMSNPLYLSGEYASSVIQYITISSLDVALPKGVVRTYAKLNQQTILLGETAINHTPKNTPLHLKLGKNFDIKVKQTLISRDARKKWIKSQVKYSLKNSSDRDKVVKLLIPFNKKSDSSIITNEKYDFEQGNMVRFNIEVKANSTKSFQVHFKSRR